MIKNVIANIEHVTVLPIVALVLFMLVFVGAALWAMGLKKSEASAYGRLPLEDASPSEGEHRHE
ncbi:MAG: hypothetical protein H3C50_00325 [Kiritimatiellae bacterium]|nr:hypothetical protein [Kiritimatiellia bacterium]MCO5068905.1 hypothetical protein [Kiritimatiellia bacterium]